VLKKDRQPNSYKLAYLLNLFVTPSALKINICSTIVRAYQFEKNLPSAAERVKKNRIKGKRGRV
jgi:hypothetical protein